MNNARIAVKLEQLADLLEFQGSNPFRLRAYRTGARLIRDLGEPVAAIVNDTERKLTDIPGIGKGVAEKCIAILETGELPQLQAILEEIPASVLDLLRIPGLGPRKAAVLFNKRNIQNLDQLKAACEAQEIRNLEGFGEKSEQAILAGIGIAAAANERIYWREADHLAGDLRLHFSGCAGVHQFEFAGSYRRGKETVGDLDILVDSQQGEVAMDRLADFPELESVIGRGKTKMSIRLHNGFQIDLRVVPSESFGAALQYFTGSKDHNVAVRGRAKQLGLKVNEWGVFREFDDISVAGSSEEEVYAAIDLPWIPPELREARTEIELSAANQLPKLISLSDIRGDLHMHTTATDGKATLQEMITAARSRGLEYIAITDHSKRVAMANGLDENRLLQQWAEIDEINKSLPKGFVVLKGIECDILEPGGMDFPNDVLEQADWVLGAIHYGQNQSVQQITDRLLGAIENPHVDCIAHPTGRLINKREPYDVNMDQVFAAAKKHDKVLELNANPARLDLNDVYCAAAQSAGIPIAINTDAHSLGGLDVMKYGINQARRGGLTGFDVVNSWSLDTFLKKLGRVSPSQGPRSGAN